MKLPHQTKSLLDSAPVREQLRPVVFDHRIISLDIHLFYQLNPLGIAHSLQPYVHYFFLFF